MAQVSQSVAAAAGAKRKRAPEPKFYAVRAGHKPGVYQTWPECLAQVKGFKGATFKSFPTLVDAQKFVAGQNPARPGDRAAHTPKFYAVKSGRVPGIYSNWESAQKQITKWKAPKHRCFATRAEAQAWLDDGAAPASAAVEEPMSAQSAADEPSNPPSAKRAKKSATAAAGTSKQGSFMNGDLLYDGYDPGYLLPPGAEDGFDSNIVYNPTTGDVVFKTPSQRAATKVQATGMAPGSLLRIYTDGSSLRNGQKEGFAGVGVYFGPGDTRNISESLPGPRQTNQRAELTAIIRALDMAPKDRDVAIMTDSEYSINCATKWADGWRRNGWKTANGKAVENKDLVESILARVEERFALGSMTSFEWIKGHAHHLGNVEADRLAVTAARNAANVPAGYRKVIK